MKKTILAAAFATTALIAGPAAATTTTLTFEGVGDEASVNDFYNGGTDSYGNSGTNYGINFSSVSLGLIDSDAGGLGNIANEPSESTVLFFLDGSAATMNVAAGFDTGFSFFYSANSTGFVNVYDGLNGTGNLLATLSLSLNFNNDSCTGDPFGDYCHWDPIGVNFAGTAKSVDFGGSANFIVFDNITLGSATPGTGAVPEPATWAMMLLGFGAAAAAMRRQRRRKVLAIA
jgi:PEP-CTERM motif-containing protein